MDDRAGYGRWLRRRPPRHECPKPWQVGRRFKIGKSRYTFAQAPEETGSLWRCAQCGRLWRVTTCGWWARATLWQRFRHRKQERP